MPEYNVLSKVLHFSIISRFCNELVSNRVESLVQLEITAIPTTCCTLLLLPRAIEVAMVMFSAVCVSQSVFTSGRGVPTLGPFTPSISVNVETTQQ